MNDVESYRRKRETEVSGGEGWLSVIGLFWLKEGDNRFGSAPDGEIVLPASAPARAGVLRLARETVTVEVAHGVPVSLRGKKVARRTLRPDTLGDPDVLVLGSLQIFVIERNGRLAVRVRDREAPA